MTGSLHALFSRAEIAKPHGRLIRCEACGADVDIIEIEIGNASSSMDPDRCGACIVGTEPKAGHTT